jgi:pimeloyl-ACP methyl ester carboxylesterase
MRFARTLEAGIANARLHIVDGAGHGLPWSHPEELNRVVREFLEQDQ